MINDLLAKVRAGHRLTHEEIAGTITTEVELESYRLGLLGRGALTNDALAAIEARRFQLQKAKGVRR